MAGMKAQFIVAPLEQVGEGENADSAGFLFTNNSDATTFAKAVQSHAQSLWRKLNGKEGGRGNKDVVKQEYGLPLQIIAQTIDANGDPTGEPFVLEELLDGPAKKT